MGDQQGPLILVVEDFLDACEMYCEYLEFHGFRASGAADGIAAIEGAKRLQPDLILMDLALPKLDGWEAVRHLKQDPETRSIPIIALTGHAMADHERRARDAGCDGFLAKPCMPDDLVREVRRHLSARRKRK